MRTARALRSATFWLRLVGLAAVVAGGAFAATAGAAPTRFTLVFEGHHGMPLGDGFRHEGTFAATTPFCPSGAMLDVQHLGAGSAVRAATCSDGSGTITLRLTNLLAEHVEGGTGTWRVLDGTGAYETLRGKGTWTSVPLVGDDEPFRATLTGLADLDDVAPTIALLRLGAAGRRGPGRTYVVSVAFSTVDNVGGNTVSYRVSLSAGSSTWSREGQSTSTQVSVAFRLRLPPAVRRIRLDVRVADPLGNDRQSVRSLALPRQHG